MARITDFLVNLRRIMKLHETLLKDICEKYGLTLIEANIISFLYSNPGRDTARDIVELRMLSKGNVSQAVELLIQKSLLKRTPDQADRRIIHLTLLPAAAPITKAIEDSRSQFQKELFSGFTEEERQLYHQLNGRIIENTKAVVKRRKLQ